MKAMRVVFCFFIGWFIYGSIVNHHNGRIVETHRMINHQSIKLLSLQMKNKNIDKAYDSLSRISIMFI